MGESYKIITFQTEHSFYQILYSYYYLYTILSKLFRLVSDKNTLLTTKAKHEVNLFRILSRKSLIQCNLKYSLVLLPYQ